MSSREADRAAQRRRFLRAVGRSTDEHADDAPAPEAESDSTGPVPDESRGESAAARRRAADAPRVTAVAVPGAASGDESVRRRGGRSDDRSDRAAGDDAPESGPSSDD